MKNILFAALALLLILSISCKESQPDVSYINQNLKSETISFSPPLYFEENRGQFYNQIKFMMPVDYSNLYLTSDEILFESKNINSDPQISELFSIKFIDANPGTKLVGHKKMKGVSNYFIGSNSEEWKTDIPHYRKVGYKELYTGIDMEFYENQKGNIEFDFIVKSGIDPDKIRMKLSGAKYFEINDLGHLEIKLIDKSITLKKPTVYQEIDEKQILIDAEYSFVNENLLCFNISDYNTAFPLIIDPEIVYSTFIGSAEARVIDVDKYGNTYLAGITDDKGFPITEGAYQTELKELRSYQADYDLFITKLNADGTDLIYSTFIGGGECNEDVFDLVVDDQGQAHITGVTYSEDFPVTEGAFKTDFNAPGEGGSVGWYHFDTFILKLDSLGSSLVYSTFLGGENDDFGFGIDIDEEGYAYVAGFTSSEHFSTTAGVFLEEGESWNEQGFVTKMNLDGSSLVFSTYINNLLYKYENVYVTDIAVDKYGNAYLTGNGILTGENTSEIPDMFIAKLNSTGSSLLFSKQIADGHSYGIDIDAGGNSYITGTANNFPNRAHLPITDNAFQKTIGDIPGGLYYGDAFLTKLDASGSTILYSTFIGGNDRDIGYDVFIDSSGNAYVVGISYSDNLIMKDAIQEEYGGSADGFVVKIDPSKNGNESLIYSTYLGGSSLENFFNSVIIYTDVAQPDHYYDEYISRGAGIAVDPKENAYIFGSTYSKDFLISEIAYDTTAPWSAKTYVTKIGKSNNNFFPHGIAYDPSNWDKDVGELQSTFSDLHVTGKNLSNVDSVLFYLNGKKDVYFEAKNIRPFTDSVAYDLIVVHGSELGYRDIKLKTNNGQLIDVTDSERKFIVSRVRTYFNQAVNQNELADHDYRDILVANKKGAVRMEFDDENQIGKSFGGFLKISDIPGVTRSIPLLYTHQDALTEQEIINGNEFLSIPIDHFLEKGEHTFTVTLLRVDDDITIRCPDIKRKFVSSAPINLWLVCYHIVYKKDRTRLNNPYISVNRQEAENAIDYLKKVYPISDNQLHFIITEDVVPIDYGAKELTFFGNKIAALDDWTSRGFYYHLVTKLINKNAERRKDDKINVIVGILPQYSLYEDKNGDGDVSNSKVDEWVAGFTINPEAVLITPRKAGGKVVGLGGVLAHEIGHQISDIALATGDFPPESDNLMDEYKTGQFNCDINPPIRGNRDIDNDFLCPNSPFTDMITGDSSAIYTDRTAYEFIENKPMLTYIGIEDTVKKFNFMGNSRADSITWVSLRTYQEMMKSLIPNSGSQLTKIGLSNDIIEISGSISKNDEAKLHPLSLSISGFPSPDTFGPYTLEIRDNSENVIKSHNFDISFIKLSDPPKYIDTTFFSVRLEKPEGAKKIVFSKDNNILAAQTLSDNAPKVSITSPNNGEIINMGTKVEWSASDDDGDELKYSIFFDKGNDDFVFLAVGITSNSHLVDNNLINNSQGTLKIFATDGYNFGADSVSNLTIVNMDESKQGLLENKFYLEQNYPNPFNPFTNIKFGLAKQSKVYLTVYNALGEKTITLFNGEVKNAGSYEITLSGKNLSSGIYFVNLKAGEFNKTTKIVLIK